MLSAILDGSVSLFRAAAAQGSGANAGGSIMFFVGFFAAISYHTPYSRPWIWPCVAIYAYE